MKCEGLEAVVKPRAGLNVEKVKERTGTGGRKAEVIS